MDSRSNLNNASFASTSVTSIEKPMRRGFLSPPPETRQALKAYLVAVTRGMILIIVVIFTYLSIYWGALWKSNTHAHNIQGWVVDFDGGVVGKAIIDLVRADVPAPTKLSWIVKDASQYPGGPEQLAAEVHEQHAWLAVSVNSGVSRALELALTSPDHRATYNASLAITGYGEEARNENAFRTVVRPQFDALFQGIVAQFAAQFVAQNISTLPQEQWTSIAVSSPQFITRPIYYTLNNMRPFDVPVAAAVTFVGLIYLVILAFMVTAISNAARQATGLDNHLSTAQLVSLRLVTNFVIYFILAVFYSLQCLAFQTPFTRHFGKSGFVIQWMLQWFGMLALGLAIEVMIIVTTHRFISFFLVFWIIVNVSPTFLPFELLPGVFKYGHAMPFVNVAQGVRTIIFGVKDKLGQNFGILIAWTVLSCFTLTFATMWSRRSTPPPAPPLKKVDTEATTNV